MITRWYLAVVWWLAWPLHRRLDRLRDTAAALSDGDLSARTGLGDEGPLGEVASALDGLAARIERLLDRQTEILRGVSHELRTPLTRIRYRLEEVVDAADPEARRREAERIEDELEAMDELIGEVLSYVRVEPGAPSLQRVPLDLSPLLDDVVETEAPLDGRVVVRRRDAGTVQLLADERLFRRAVRNLVANAVRHATARVEVELVDRGAILVVIVDDDGPGVAPDDRERVFQPFVRLQDGRKRDPKGSGLGLAMVRRIAVAHAGQVHIDTSPLGGARFVIEVPPRPY